MIGVCIYFLPIFIRFGKPTWKHVGRFFPQNGGGLVARSPLFVGLMSYFDFSAVLAPSCWYAGSIRERGFILEVVGSFSKQCYFYAWDVLGYNLVLDGLVWLR